MKEATEYFERILWFIYRELFTLFPSLALLFITSLFLNSFFPDILQLLETSFFSFGIEKWIVLFAVIFCLNLILESFTHFYVFKLINFRKLSQERYANDKSLISFLQKGNPLIFDIITKNDNKISLEATLFNLGLIRGEEKSSWFNNYLWFLISREFLLCNLSIVIIICYLFFFPYYLYIKYSLYFAVFIRFQIFQIVLVFILFLYTRWILILNYPEYDPYIPSIIKRYILASLPFLTAITGLIISIYVESNFQTTALILESLLFIICPLLFLRALREYINVEYLIITSFAKDSYEIRDQSITSNVSKSE